MVGFGRRNNYVHQDKAAAPAPEPEAPGPIAIAALVVLLAIVLLQHPEKQIRADRTAPLPRDLAPGLQVSAAPYVTPAGCPSRQWMTGEYLPAACTVGYRIDPEFGEQIGLEWPRIVGKTRGRRTWRSFRQREWVRAGDDALLLTRPENAAGKILYVARGRLTGPGLELRPDGQDYRRPPTDYIVRGAVDLLFVPLVVLGVTGAAFLCFPIRPSKKRGE